MEKCPCCNLEFEAAECFRGEARPPKAGDFAFCDSCLQPLERICGGWKIAVVIPMALEQAITRERVIRSIHKSSLN